MYDLDLLQPISINQAGVDILQIICSIARAL